MSPSSAPAPSSSPAPSNPSPTHDLIAAWLAVPEEKRAELIDGTLVYEALPGPKHGRVQRAASVLTRAFDEGSNNAAGNDGGWWLSLEVDMHIGGIGCRPDLLGWRRERHPALPEPDARGLVTDVPQWVCEVLSPSTSSVDWGKKRLAYHRAGVEHYWLADYTAQTLTVLRLTDAGYLVVLSAGPGETVRAEPFDAIEIQIDTLFG